MGEKMRQQAAHTSLKAIETLLEVLTMAVVPNFSAILVLAHCVKDASCPWWTTDAGPSPLFIWGVFLGLIGLIFLANIVRSRK